MLSAVALVIGCCAYGAVTQQSGISGAFGYAGMLQHSPSGLNLTWYRAYDPASGRWLSRDPIEESGGINLYAYVGGNPISQADPTGLEAEVIAPAVVAIPSTVALAESVVAACTSNPAACAAAVGGTAGLAGGSLLYPVIERPLSGAVDMCFARGHEENCEAVRDSILNACASLTGETRRRCVAAANESYRQCLSQH